MQCTLQGLLCSNLVSVRKAAWCVAAEFRYVTPCSLVDCTDFSQESAATIICPMMAASSSETSTQMCQAIWRRIPQTWLSSASKISVRIRNKNNAITNYIIRSTCSTHFTCKNTSTRWYSQTSRTIAYKQCQLAQSLL